MDSAQAIDLFGDVSQREKLSEIKPPLKRPKFGKICSNSLAQYEKNRLQKKVFLILLCISLCQVILTIKRCQKMIEDERTKQKLLEFDSSMQSHGYFHKKIVQQ